MTEIVKEFGRLRVYVDYWDDSDSDPNLLSIGVLDEDGVECAEFHPDNIQMLHYVLKENRYGGYFEDVCDGDVRIMYKDGRICGYLSSYEDGDKGAVKFNLKCHKEDWDNMVDYILSLFH